MPNASSTSLPPLDRPSPFDICPHRAAVAAQHRRSNHPPPGTEVRLSDARRRAIADAAHLHAALGAARDRGHVRTRITVDSTVRLLKGVQSDVAALSDRNSLEAKTRSVARLGRALPNGSLRRVLQREAEAVDSINRLFDHADVVLTRCSQYPPHASTTARPEWRFARSELPTPQRGSSLERHRPARTRGPVRHPQTQPPSLDHFAGLPNDEGTPARAGSADAAGRPFPRWSPTPPTINSPGQAIEQPRPSPLTTALATDMVDVLVARWGVLCCQRTPTARSERRRSASGPNWCRDGLRQLNIRA